MKCIFNSLNGFLFLPLHSFIILSIISKENSEFNFKTIFLSLLLVLHFVDYKFIRVLLYEKIKINI
jgi:hypothetical protein